MHCNLLQHKEYGKLAEQPARQVRVSRRLEGAASEEVCFRGRQAGSLYCRTRSKCTSRPAYAGRVLNALLYR